MKSFWRTKKKPHKKTSSHQTHPNGAKRRFFNKVKGFFTRKRIMPVATNTSPVMVHGNINKREHNINPPIVLKNDGILNPNGTNYMKFAFMVLKTYRTYFNTKGLEELDKLDETKKPLTDDDFKTICELFVNIFTPDDKTNIYNKTASFNGIASLMLQQNNEQFKLNNDTSDQIINLDKVYNYNALMEYCNKYLESQKSQNESPHRSLSQQLKKSNEPNLAHVRSSSKKNISLHNPSTHSPTGSVTKSDNTPTPPPRKKKGMPTGKQIRSGKAAVIASRKSKSANPSVTAEKESTQKSKQKKRVSNMVRMFETYART